MRSSFQKLARGLVAKRTTKGGSMFADRPRVDMAAYCASAGIPVRTLHPESVQHRPGSRTVPEQMLDLIINGQKYAGRDKERWEAIRYARLYAGEYYTVPSIVLAELSGATLYTPSGIVIAPDGTVLRDSTVTFDDFANPPPGASMEDPPAISGCCLSLLSLWDWNYAHWLMDCLPRLGALRDCPAETKVLVRANPQRFQRESLELLGIPAHRIVEIEAPFVRVERLCVLRSGGVTGVPHQALMRQLRHDLLEAAKPPAAPRERRLFISRSKTRSRSSSQRRILNQIEVEGVLQKHRFETVHPETLPFAEQVRLFAGASALAGAHGAGSYNLIFAPAETPVLEFYNHAYWEHAACRIAGLIGQPHFHLFSENADAERNFHVDTGHLAKLLSAAVPGKNMADAVEAIF